MLLTHRSVGNNHWYSCPSS